MDRVINKVFDMWFEDKQKENPQNLTRRKDKDGKTYYLVGKEDISDFMNIIGAFVPMIATLRCSIHEDCIVFTDEDLDRVICLR